MKELAVLLMFTLSAVLANAQALPETTGQKLLKQDQAQLHSSLAVCKRIAADDVCISITNQAATQLYGLVAQILSAELTHERIIEYNRQHPISPQADVADVIDTMVELHGKVAALFAETVRKLESGN